MKSFGSQKIKTVPDDYTSITPWIISPSSVNLIAFLIAAFDAREVPNSRITNDEGVIIHVVVKIGNALVMLFDSRTDWASTPSFLNLYVDDVESAYQKALELGAKSVTDITTLYFGEKVCRVLDPFGNLWWINQRVEEVDFTNPAEIGQRASTPEAIEGIAYIQKSLDGALKTQKRFFENKAAN
ncbi:VOC family protein [Mucilaginibacter ginsenosidivorax]|uniref:VOC family protein n=1 Tax=Mucilaginibacter ginsenosidivorax TaxID=862126 RepID=A0A5B8VYQ5_9SPHI|nr:VOC family protein [Mucilaginibacter ginsenosidivorax]QEC76697.1 VOC family protein [Mucilaginibacter ginsenosidivorax]